MYFILFEDIIRIDNQPPNSEEEKEIQTTCTDIQKELINRSYYIQLYNGME